MIMDPAHPNTAKAAVLVRRRGERHDHSIHIVDHSITSSITMKQKVFRPSLNDVDRISLGKGAQRRGTGSRYVPHRLNQDERQLYNHAKENNYLVVKGTAYRRRRKGSPLCNTFRQRCDALEQLCIVIEKYTSGDRIKIDFSTLRVRDDAHQVSQICNLMNAKYPDLIDHTTNYCKDVNIDWEALQNKSIWNIEPRLVNVEPVDRAVAKNIAEDVLNERFTDMVDDKMQREDQSGWSAIEDDSSDDAEDASGSRIDDETDEIDWDDI